MHEVVEDAVLYPAVRPVSEDTEIACAGHGLLRAQAAFRRHAGPEERSISPQPGGATAPARLLDDRSDRERTARAQAFRDFKLGLTEQP